MAKRGRKPIDIAGQKFHHLVAVRPGPISSDKYFFKCDLCGNEVLMRKGNVTKLDRGNVACGCQQFVKSRRIKPFDAGKRFGRLVVVGVLPPKKREQIRYKCLCDCGQTSTPTHHSLAKGTTKSCGCSIFLPRIDLSGQRFGKLVVDSYDYDGRWNCTCDCGNKTTALRGNLTRGTTRSCGCLRRTRQTVETKKCLVSA